MADQYKIGDRVKGPNPPAGGRWEYDAEKDELVLVEEPTKYE